MLGWRQAVREFFGNIPLSAMIYVGNASSDIEASREMEIPVVAAAWAETAVPAQLIPLKPHEILYRVADSSEWLIQKI